MIEIKHRHSGRVILEVAAESLENANLAGEYLIHADFQKTNLATAKLLFANMSGADLTNANLAGANLRGANLTEVNMTGVDFQGVNLAGATLSLTVLSNCRNLHQAVGLDEILHAGPSELDSDTLRASVPHLSNTFLRGVGYTWSEIYDLRTRFQESAEG